MNILNDKEHRLFLSAMQREKAICERLDNFHDSGIKLLPICRSIEKKVNKAIIQRDGVWIKVTSPSVFGNYKLFYKCPFCNTLWDRATAYCPNCGSKLELELD